ncbi:MAG: hypothetical protein IT384_10510 [Deltaproteobacteria bacterium]|nr:hypothetical protein [Deltaproteobacteria bacterium]
MGPTYITRLCVNTMSWRRPSGRLGKARDADAFETTNGFGFEEWLFDFDRLIEIDGVAWKYGFLQGVNRSRSGGRRLAGQVIDAGLFTISDEGKRDYVARLRELEVLEDHQAIAAWSRMRELGHVTAMAAEVEAAGGDPRKVLDVAAGPDGVNVRFRPETAEFEPSLRRQASKDDALSHVPGYYQLYDADKYPGLEWRTVRFGSPEMPTALRPTGRIARAGGPATLADDVHNRHQNALYRRLRALYPGVEITMERGTNIGRTDIEFMDGSERVVIEVKPDLDPRLAIRAAVGQLLEYGFWPSAPSARSLRLVVAAPAGLTVEADLYLKHLREKLRLPIKYVQTHEDPSRILWPR